LNLKAFILSLIVVFASGCVVIGAGAASAVGGVYYLSGEIRASYDTSIQHLYDVSLYTFEQENIKTISVTNSVDDADIIGRAADGETITIHIYYNKKEQATIGIRIGKIGDEKRSRELLKKIQRYL